MEEVEVTWMRATGIWWSLIWSTGLFGALAGALAGFFLGLVFGGMVQTENLEAYGQLVGLIAMPLS